MTALIFILVLLVTVLVHEWGHYFAAKKSGMVVDEFGFGIPPKLFSWKKKETEFSINALPIGGFVRIAGESGDPRPDVAEHRLFTNRPKISQAIVLFAGVACNFVLGWLLLSGSYMLGVPQVAETGTPEVISVLPNSPAAAAGLQLRDKILLAAVEGKAVQNPHTEDIRSLIQEAPGKPIIFTLEQGKEQKTVTITPVISAETGAYSIGIAAEPLSVIKEPVHKAIWLGLKDAWEITKNVVGAFGKLIAGIFSKASGGLSEFIGPVGLATAISDASQVGISYFLSFVALISLNLAVLNLVPFPALDGGRLLILGLEALFKRKFNKTMVGVIHAIGFGLLILLMVVLTVQDIRRL